jgi:6-phosphogluconate dehydrogenase
MKIGLAGLGTMGSQIAEKLLAAGHELVVDSRHAENTDPLVAKGAESFTDYEDLLNKLGDDPIIWLMIQHDYVPAEVDKLLQIWPKGGMIVDGGNSRYTSSVELGEQASKQGVAFVDVGTSGGVWGKSQGFSMMVGGEEAAVARIAPLLDVLTQPNAAWYRFGPTGAGHFVKMVHNGVEYGIMQSYAEGYRVMREGPFADVNLGKVAEVWQHRSINESFLNSLIERMLKRDPDFTGVEGVVHESGEARWTLETANELDVPTPAIQSAFDVRLQSQAGETNYATKFLAQLRNEFGGHAVNPDKKE